MSVSIFRSQTSQTPHHVDVVLNMKDHVFRCFFFRAWKIKHYFMCTFFPYLPAVVIVCLRSFHHREFLLITVAPAPFSLQFYEHISIFTFSDKNSGWKVAGRGQDLDNVETILIRCQRRRRAKHAAKATKSPPVTDILIHYNFNIHALEGKGGVGRRRVRLEGGGGGSICRTRNKTYGVQTWSEWAIFGRGNNAKCHEEEENKKGTTWLTLFEKKKIF